MDILVIVLLVIAAIVLFMIELFIIPGISLASFAAVTCLVIANYLAYVHIGVTAFIVTLVLSLLAMIATIIIFLRSKTLDRIALKQTIDSSVENLKMPSVKVGDIGITTTRLALVGYADMDGKIVEVTSCDGFLSAKTPIKVERITDGTIYVSKQ